MRCRLCAVTSILFWLAGCSAGSVPQTGMPESTARAPTLKRPLLLIAGTAKQGTGLYTFAASRPPRFISFRRLPTLHAIAVDGSSLYLGEGNRIEVRDRPSGRLLMRLRDASSAPHFSVDAITLFLGKVYAAANVTQCANGAQVCGGTIAVYRHGQVHPETRIRWPNVGRVSSLSIRVLAGVPYIAAGWTDRHRGEHVSRVQPGSATELNTARNGAQPPWVAFIGDFLAIGAGSSGAFGTGEVELYSVGTGTVVKRFGHLNGALVLAPDAGEHRLFVGAYGFFLLPQSTSDGAPPGIAVFAYPSGFRTGTFGDFTAVYSMAATPQ